MPQAHHVQRARRHHADDDRDSQRDLVGDHLARLAHGAVNRPLVVAGPAGQDHAHHFDREDGQDPEEPDVEVGLEGHVRAEGQGEERRERRRERQVRRDPKEQRIRRPGHEVFFGQQLDPVRQRLEDPDRPDPVRPDAALHMAGDFALPPDAEHRHQRDDGEEHPRAQDHVVSGGREGVDLDAERIEDKRLDQ